MTNCKKCNKQITNPGDVNVLALFGIIPTTMCNDCYTSCERGVVRYYIYYPKWMPLNSTLFTILLVIGTIIFLGIIIAVLLGTVTIDGKPTEWSSGIKILISLTSLLLLVVLGWQWTLWFIARNIVNKTKLS